MRQAVKAQVLTSHTQLGEHGLRQILTDVIEEVQRLSHKDINGAEVLYSLLNAPWLQSLLKVYECLQKFQREPPTPALNYASGLSLQLVADIRALRGCSEQAKELYCLLRQPHLQALLSAQDTVAQKDYDPVLPPMPDELPEDEEATRIVCLVKNKQPLLSKQERIGLTTSGEKGSRGGIRSHWDTLRRLTQQKLIRGGAVGGQSLGAGEQNLEVKEPMKSVRRGSYPSAEHLRPSPPPPPRPYPPPHHKPMSNCRMPYANPGATIKRNEITGEIFVARVIHGGLADRSGLLHAGDRIMEVNGFPVDGLEPEQVIQVLQARSHGTIMFKVVPITERPVHNQTRLCVRAMADYSPQQDPSIPCADAGMGFRKGDLLEIVDQTDALWWQARKLPSTSTCAGLIPSANLLKRKQREFWWSQPYQPHACIQTLSTVDEEEDLMAIDVKCVEADEEAFESEELREEEGEFSSNVEGVYVAGFRRSMRLCRRRSHSTSQSSCHTRCPGSCYSALTGPYEEVVRYQRLPQEKYRLVALLGPSGVGVNELRRRLIEINPNIFQGAVPHTTRAPKSYEECGREYHFTSREVFDNMVYNNKFLEYGEYKGRFYGTSIESVKEVLASGKICVIDIEPNALQSVRTHELKAYVVYVKPPPGERLRETRQAAHITTPYYVNRPFKDEDFQEMEDAARKIESHYCQFFDQVIVNDELQDSCMQLLTAVWKAQDEPQWVPASWIRPSDES